MTISQAITFCLTHHCLTPSSSMKLRFSHELELNFESQEGCRQHSFSQTLYSQCIKMSFGRFITVAACDCLWNWLFEIKASFLEWWLLLLCMFRRKWWAGSLLMDVLREGILELVQCSFSQAVNLPTLSQNPMWLHADFNTVKQKPYKLIEAPSFCRGNFESKCNIIRCNIEVLNTKALRVNVTTSNE